MYIEETKFKLQKRIGKHKKDAKYRRDNSAIVKHIMEQVHRMDWDGATCLEKETRTIPRKIIEGCYIRGNKGKYMNLNEDMSVSTQYKRGEGAWIWRKRKDNKERDVTGYRTALKA